jgi:hypothetical protein
VSDTRRPPRLSGDEVAIVLRRAVELEALTDDVDGGGPEGYDPAALEEAAREVGLSPATVRQAVAELRAGVLPVPAPQDRKGVARRRTTPGGMPTPVAGSRMVAQQRLVEPTPAEVDAVLDRFMRTQMFELRRRAGDRAVYRPRRDLVANLRRRLDFAGAIRLDHLATVTTVVVPAEERTLVRVEAELVASRANAVAGGAAAGSAVAVLMGFIGAVFTEWGLVMAALPAGAIVGGGGIRVAEARWRRRRDDVAEALGGLLDRL